MDINILIEKLEKFTDKTVLLEDGEYQSKYFKPIKIDERLVKLKKDFDKNIFIENNKLIYLKDIEGLKDLLMFEKFYKDFIINVHGSVSLSNCNLNEIPVQFDYVKGNFLCNNNQLTSLKGCPNYVGNYFTVSYNQLTSLEHCPKEVSGSFCCSNNLKKFTKGEVRKYCKAREDIVV